MFVKLIERDEARRLRREEGLAIRLIAEQLGVSKSSVSVWTRDIELTEEQHERLRQANPIHNQQLRGQGSRRRDRPLGAARGAGARAGAAGQADLLHLQGCMLFWAEGSRRRNSVVFTNSDVEMHRVFLRFLRWCRRRATSRSR